jgi:hypothetical protein
MATPLEPTALAKLLGTKEFWQRLRTSPAQLAAEVCSINIVQIDETLQMHASLRAWVNAALEVARIDEAKLTWHETKTRAAILLMLKRIDPDTNKPKTVTMLDAEAIQQPELQKITEQILKQKEITGGLKAIEKALEDRKDMLIQIAAKQRKEMDQ